MVGAPPQRALPASNNMVEMMYSHFALKIPYNLPLQSCQFSDVGVVCSDLPSDQGRGARKYERDSKPTQLAYFTEFFDYRRLNVCDNGIIERE